MVQLYLVWLYLEKVSAVSLLSFHMRFHRQDLCTSSLLTSHELFQGHFECFRIRKYILNGPMIDRSGCVADNQHLSSTNLSLALVIHNSQALCLQKLVLYDFDAEFHLPQYVVRCRLCLSQCEEHFRRHFCPHVFLSVVH